MAQKTARAFPEIQSAPPVAKGQASPQLEPVQAFLKRFGYLPSAAGAVPGALDDPTAEALSLYQRKNGLPVTGVFDEATRAEMSKHRCGMPI